MGWPDKTETKMVKEHIKNQDDEEDDEINMGEYYTKIMNNLNKKKK